MTILTIIFLAVALAATFAIQTARSDNGKQSRNQQP